MSDLQRNTLLHLFRTLDDLSSTEKQRRYKAAVPFVHVPFELSAQWDNYARLGREAEWFRELFTAEELAAIAALNVLFEALHDAFGEHLPDVPRIEGEPRWTAIQDATRLLRDELGGKRPR